MFTFWECFWHDVSNSYVRKREEHNDNPVKVTKTEFLKIYEFESDGQRYKVAITKLRANRKIIIRCSNNHVLWEERVPLGISPISVLKFICQPSMLLEDGVCCILVISGKPDAICGLDQGRIASVASLMNGISKDKLYVMSRLDYNRYIKANK